MQHKEAEEVGRLVVEERQGVRPAAVAADLPHGGRKSAEVVDAGSC